MMRFFVCVVRVTVRYPALSTDIIFSILPLNRQRLPEIIVQELCLI